MLCMSYEFTCIVHTYYTTPVLKAGHRGSCLSLFVCTVFSVTVILSNTVEPPIKDAPNKRPNLKDTLKVPKVHFPINL